jgi:UDP-N-acetylmuramate--alanine ligase
MSAAIPAVEPAQAPLSALPDGAHIHMIGVAGAGMNALATALLARGYRLSGSDQQPSAPVEHLIAGGLRFFQGHAAAQIQGADLVIISAAIREENPELGAARAAAIPVVKRAAALGWLLRDRHTIAVAGTHGKTTTSAMLAVILHRAGVDPTFVVGGEVLDLGASARIGSGDWAVVEADEYDHSFLQLRPRIAVITNVEADHLEYFGSEAAMQAAYADFIARIQPGGVLVYNHDDAFLRAQRPPTGSADAGSDPAVPRQEGSAAAAPGQIGVRRIGCSLRAAADWYATRVEARQDGTTFLVHGPSGAGEARLQVPGLHNVSNAVQAIAAAAAAGIAPSHAIKALADFHGAVRRFQILGQVRGVMVIDDYAHHPTEIRATLAAARQRFPDRRLVAVFQPHTYSRTKLLFEHFLGAFDLADTLILTDIYAARETDTLGMHTALLASAIARRAGAPAVLLINPLAALPGELAARVSKGDVVLTLGAGTITQVGPALLAILAGEAAGG